MGVNSPAENAEVAELEMEVYWFRELAAYEADTKVGPPASSSVDVMRLPISS